MQGRLNEVASVFACGRPFEAFFDEAAYLRAHRGSTGICTASRFQATVHTLGIVTGFARGLR